MRLKSYEKHTEAKNESREKDKAQDQFWVHSMIPAAPDTYAMRAYEDKNEQVLMEKKLVLFWALVEWSDDNSTAIAAAKQKIVPVFTAWDGTRAELDVTPNVDENIMGYASRQQLASVDQSEPCSIHEWARAAKDHIKKIVERNRKR